QGVEQLVGARQPVEVGIERVMDAEVLEDERRGGLRRFFPDSGFPDALDLADPDRERVGAHRGRRRVCLDRLELASPATGGERARQYHVERQSEHDETRAAGGNHFEVVPGGRRPVESESAALRADVWRIQVSITQRWSLCVK